MTSQNMKSEEDSGQVSTDVHERDGLRLWNLTLNLSTEYESTDSPSILCKNNSESNTSTAKSEIIYT